MLELGVSIVDRLVQLLALRERNRKEYFHEFIDPLYKDAEVIVNDYFRLFGELIVRLKGADSADEVIDWIEQRRQDMRSVRIKVRELLKDASFSAGKVPEEYRVFARGLWGVMKGGASLVEDGHAQLWEYGMGDHTVLDLMRIFSRNSSIDDHRERYIRNARQQLSALESAWKDTTKGYSKLKRKALKPV
jgi:hypothetical protein